MLVFVDACPTVFEPPDQPGVPRASSKTHNSLQLSWDKPKYGSDSVQSYTVSYRLADYPPSDQWSTQTSSEECLVLTKLTPGLLYHFKVTAESSVGSSPESDVGEERLPPDQPGKPETMRKTHNSLQLKWTKPEHGASLVSSYTVYCCLENSPSDQWNTKTNSNEECLVITKLTPGSLYHFKVTAESVVGSSPDSEIGEERLPPDQPGKPEIIKKTHNSLQLRWYKPEHGVSIVSSYNIHYRSVDDPPDQWSIHITTEEYLTLIELSPAIQYHIKVRAISAAGSSPDSKVLIERLPPNQPGRPQVIEKSHNSIQLKWEKPKHGAHIVQSYSVHYHLADGPWCIQTSIEESATLTKLTPGSLYYFKVTAESAVGSSPESKVLIEGLPPNQPGRPQVIEKSHNSIQLKWEKPKHGAHIVQSYSVHYHLADGPWCIQASIEESAILTKLTPGSLYYFKVTAESAVGSSPASETILVTLPPGEPGIPFSTQVTPNAIKIQWAKPKHGAESVKYYNVSYRSVDDQSDQWSSQSTNDAQEYAWLTNLVPNRSYIVKAQAVNFNNENGPESEPNDNPIDTFLSPPGKPRATYITRNCVRLSWEKPEHGAESVQMYTVSINDKWQIHSTRNCSVLIQGLYSEMPYIFKVRAETNLGPSPDSESSDLIEMVLLPSDIPYIAEASLSTLETIPGEFSTSQAAYTELSQSRSPDFVEPAIHKTTDSKKKLWGAKPSQNKRYEEATPYQLPLYYTTSKENSFVKKAVVGALPVQSKMKWSLPVPHKILMLVGATGSGKTTLINAMVNYIMGVDWEDEYRFKLISEETAHDQTKSQTKCFTAYTFHKDGRSPLPYTLTVIDTPGFGDTGGLKRDKEIVVQIKEFFSIRGDEDIDQIHGIGFVTQAPLVRLTPTQLYIYDSILAVFGKDVVDNIFLMVTFADEKRPPVLDAARAAGVRFRRMSHFKFNNSAFFASNQTDDKFEIFWRMGENSFRTFFDHFSRARPQSLQQSRKVLQECEHLEVRMQGLQPLIRAGLAKIYELQQEKRLIQIHKSKIIAADKSFTYEVQVVCHKCSLSKGRYTTNCLKCNFTCHENCPHSHDGNTFMCSAMNDPGSLDATCAVCPGRCSWKDHVWNPYKFEIYVALETRASEALMIRSNSTLANIKSQVEEVIMRIDSELNEVTLSVFQVIKQAHQIMQNLLKLALKPHDLTVVDYIDLLIEHEKHEALQSELVAVLHEVRKQSIGQMRSISKDSSFLYSKDVLEDQLVVFRQLPDPDMRENKNLMKLWPTITKNSTPLDEQISLPVSSTHFDWKKSENACSTVAKVIYFLVCS